MKVSHRHHIVGTDGSIRIGRRAAAEVAVTVKADDGSGDSNLAEHSLHHRVPNDSADGPERNRALFLVLTLGTCLCNERLDAAQWRRDIELHHRHYAAVLGPDKWLRILCPRSGLRRGFAKCKKHKCDCR